MVDNITIVSASGRGSVTMANHDYAGYWLGTVDWGEVTGQNKLYSYYNQLGETVVSTAIGSRELSVEGWIIEHSGVTLRQRSDFLNSFISPVDEYDLLYNGWKIRFRPTSSVIYSRTRKSDNAMLRKFLIQAICPQPFFTGVEETVAPFDFSAKQFRFPTGFGQANPVVFATTDKLFNTRIHNPGGFATGVTIRIDFIGDVVNPRIKDLQTNQLIGVNRAFANGDQLTMVTVPGHKSMTLRHEDQSEENVIKNRHVSTSWLQLAPGSNIWAVECDDLQQRVNMQVRVCFSPLYLEVE